MGGVLDASAPEAKTAAAAGGGGPWKVTHPHSVDGAGEEGSGNPRLDEVCLVPKLGLLWLRATLK